MNTLGYILLCMLVRKPCTGYELREYLKLFWQAHHSQIYPLLAKLEQENYITHEHVPNTNPPQKLYSLTVNGEQVVQEWLTEDTSEPVERDVFLAKIYIVAMIEPETVQQLFSQRRALMAEKIKRNQTKVKELEALRQDFEQREVWQNNLGRYLIMKRRVKFCIDELEWCDWAEDLYLAYFSQK